MILNCIPNIAISPSIHSQLTAIGRNDSAARFDVAEREPEEEENDETAGPAYVVEIVGQAVGNGAVQLANLKTIATWRGPCDNIVKLAGERSGLGSINLYRRHHGIAAVLAVIGEVLPTWSVGYRFEITASFGL